ncbi:hypothetical protein [Novosphingopyxis sp.]|uniref:hypothetical protein n=1 Tax=Novosphingopyxis sp. TaxID=2709690 RepID=UPI003B5C8AB8
MPSAKRPDKRSARSCIKVYLDDKQLAAVDARRGSNSRSAWCRDRIMASENFHDPLFAVASRFAGVAAAMQSEREHVERMVGAATMLGSVVQHQADTATLALADCGVTVLSEVAQDMKEALRARTSVSEEVVQSARDLLAMVNERQQRARTSMPWTKRKP